jgi:hypothetical protein
LDRKKEGVMVKPANEALTPLWKTHQIGKKQILYQSTLKSRKEALNDLYGSS